MPAQNTWIWRCPIARKPDLRIEPDRVRHELDVRPIELRPRADDDVAAVQLAGKRAAAEQRPPHARQHDAIEPQLPQEA